MKRLGNKIDNLKEDINKLTPQLEKLNGEIESIKYSIEQFLQNSSLTDEQYEEFVNEIVRIKDGGQWFGLKDFSRVDSEIDMMLKMLLNMKGFLNNLE